MVAAAVLLVAVAAGRWGELADVDLDLSPGWIVPATLVATAANVLLALGWRRLLGAYGHALGTARALRTWALSQATRYLPSGLVPVAARAALAAPDGVPRTIGAASVVVETAALLGWAALACALWAPGGWIHPALRLVLGAAALAGLTTLPFTLAGVRTRDDGRVQAALTRLSRRFRFGARVGELAAGGSLRARRAGVWGSTGVYGVAVAARLASFALLAAAVLPIGDGDGGIGPDVRLVVGAAAAATVVGMVGVTPAGLGVRETLLATLLADRFGFGDALAYSVALRAWEIALETAFLAVVAYTGRRGAGVEKASGP